MKRKKVLLIALSEAVSVYKEAKVKEALEHIPYLPLACLAAMLLKNNHEAGILDLSLYENPTDKLNKKLNEFNPDFVGISFTTPLYKEMKPLAKQIKEYNKEIVVIGGGPHCTIFPKQTLEESDLDVAVIGEGDYTIVEIVEKDIRRVKGIAYKKGKKIIINEKRDLIRNMDELPFPSWHLFEINSYYVPRLRAKLNPVGPIETSRGCPFNCTFCNKAIHGYMFRAKSPKRVVDEMEYMLKCGFKEIHIKDDGFTTDINRAIKICDLIIERGLKFSWNLVNGIRVDRANGEFFMKAAKAGCHSLGIGIESGSQIILDSINKNITLDMARETVRLCKKSGIESIGYFIIGFPKDTEKTIKETINFALSLDLDMAKATIFMPFPGTASFKELEEKGLITSKDWSDYNYHSSSAKKVFKHPSISWDKIFYYHDLFHRKFYFRPKKMLEIGIKSIKDGTLL